MTQVQLNCPHCGGAFTLNDQLVQTKTWTCPYCGKDAILSKTDTGLRLDAILHEARDLHPGSQDEPQGQTSHAVPSARPSPLETETAPRSLSDYIAEVDQPAAESQQAEPVQTQAAPSLLELVQEAQQAASSGDYPLFNALSRRVLDQNPHEHLIYFWRTLLIEEADGFARNTWATPVWYLYTPRQKSMLLSQHAYTLNTALSLADHAEKANLCLRVGQLLVRQAVDHLTEKASLRCGRRLLGKTFKGRFKRRDLFEARDFCDAVGRLTPGICPLGSELLQTAVRQAAQTHHPRLARALTRF